ncbi:hypothetical protein HY642_03835 [Candidatus Woesearchaeota archaeon]|nr:hypothetical protein [Candidatus Woesearchaeota archaeon]
MALKNLDQLSRDFLREIVRSGSPFIYIGDVVKLSDNYKPPSWLKETRLKESGTVINVYSEGDTSTGYIVRFGRRTHNLCYEDLTRLSQGGQSKKLEARLRNDLDTLDNGVGLPKPPKHGIVSLD